MSKIFQIPKSASRKLSRTGEGVDVAARYFVYKLYDATRHNSELWHSVGNLGELAATVSRAVERGWVNIRDEGAGRAKLRQAALTDYGRQLARKSAR